MQGQMTKVTTSSELGLEITVDSETRMYPDVHFLGGKLLTVWREWLLPRRHTNATKAHPIPLEISTRRRFPTTSGRPSDGLQTFTNFPGGKSQVDSSLEHSYRLGVSNLQE